MPDSTQTAQTPLEKQKLKLAEIASFRESADKNIRETATGSTLGRGISSAADFINETAISAEKSLERGLSATGNYIGESFGAAENYVGEGLKSVGKSIGGMFSGEESDTGVKSEEVSEMST